MILQLRTKTFGEIDSKWNRSGQNELMRKSNLLWHQPNAKAIVVSLTNN